MKEIIADLRAENSRLDRYIASAFGRISIAQAQKLIRQKNIRLNGKHPPLNARVHQGDAVRLYVPDELLAPPEKKPDPFYAAFRWKLSIVYEDEHLLLVDKRPGLLCHADRNEKVNSLIHHVRAYLYQTGAWDPAVSPFVPSLCNRIDRFTGGIVIAAKTREALAAVNQKIRDHEIRKLYLCIVHGRMPSAHGTLSGYLAKTPGGRRVQVLAQCVPGAQSALTSYRTFSQRDGLSLLECELFTGRTHQIRAQLAACGHPLLGDGQYGSADECRAFQALYAYCIRFAFTSDAGPLASLNGRRFQVRSVPFVKEYFPDFAAEQGGSPHEA